MAILVDPAQPPYHISIHDHGEASRAELTMSGEMPELTLATTSGNPTVSIEFDGIGAKQILELDASAIAKCQLRLLRSPISPYSSIEPHPTLRNRRVLVDGRRGASRSLLYLTRHFHNARRSEFDQDVVVVDQGSSAAFTFRERFGNGVLLKCVATTAIGVSMTMSHSAASRLPSPPTQPKGLSPAIRQSLAIDQSSRRHSRVTPKERINNLSNTAAKPGSSRSRYPSSSEMTAYCLPSWT